MVSGRVITSIRTKKSRVVCSLRREHVHFVFITQLVINAASCELLDFFGQHVAHSSILL